MPKRFTFRTPRSGHYALLLAGLLVACGSREQQDWHAAETADTSEAWEHFLEQHPGSELAPQARARIAQMETEREWARTDKIGTLEAYRAFLASHPKGKWAEQARIRIEGFSLGSAPRTAPWTPEEAAASAASSRVRALHLAKSSAEPASAAIAAGGSGPPVGAAPASAAAYGGGSGFAQAGEAAVAPRDAAAATRGAPVPRTGDAPAVVYGVQLGAFGSQAGATREWQHLQGQFSSELGGREPRIVAASSGAGTVYRLQVPTADAAEARSLCASLREHSQACVPVVPH